MASAQVVTRMRRLSSGFGRCFLGASWLGQAQAAVEETTQTVVDSSRKRISLEQRYLLTYAAALSETHLVVEVEHIAVGT